VMLGAFGIMSALAGDLGHARGAGPLNGGIAPFETYATQDGRAMALGALEPKFWIAFCTGVGIEPAMDALMPGPHQVQWKQRLRDVFAQRTQSEWIAFAEKATAASSRSCSPRRSPATRSTPRAELSRRAGLSRGHGRRPLS